MPTIKFLNEKKDVQVEPGANLRDAALANGIDIHHHGGLLPLMDASARYLNCSILSDLAKRKLGPDTPIANIVGGGTCGTCHVYIKKGMENCSPKTMKEKIRFSLAAFTIGHEDEVRLACQTQVNGDIEVQTRPPMNLYGETFWQ